MKDLTYMQFIHNLITDFDIGVPILVRELGGKMADYYGMNANKANAATAVAVKRILEADTIPNLRCFGKGIYYLTRKTVFGETGINKEKLIELKYLDGNNGYETGASVMHKIGLTSLMPVERVIVSNYAQGRTKIDHPLDIIVKAPKTPVNKENRLYLQFLDLLSIYDEVPVDAEEPYKILGNFIQTEQLDYGKLLNIADRHYNNDTILRLAHIAGRQGAGL